MNNTTQALVINELAALCHEANRKWWEDPITKEPKVREFAGLIALCHSELSEALEGDRKDLMDDKLPHRKMREVELADAVIRILQLAAEKGMDIGGAFVEKMAFNAIREDHKLENRVLAGGKAY